MKPDNRPTILDPKKQTPGRWVTTMGSITKWKHIFMYNDKRRKPIEYRTNSKNPYTSYTRDELLQAIHHVEQFIAAECHSCDIHTTVTFDSCVTK